MKQLFQYKQQKLQLSNLARHNLYHLKGYYFCRALIFGYVIERLYWASKGISVGDTVILEFIYALVLTAMEIPSGIWADRFGRKQLILASAILAFFSNSLLLLSGFAAFALSVVISATYGAFSSGSVNALLYDSLLAGGDEDHFASCLAGLKKWKLISYILAALSGSFMAAHFNMTLNYQLSLLSCAGAVCFSYQLKEPVLKSTSEANETHWSKVYWQGLTQLFKNKGVLPALIGGLMTGASIIYIDEFWQNYCQMIPLPIVFFGFVSLAFGGFQALSNHFLERFGESVQWQNFVRKSLGLICVVYSCLFILLGQTPGWWGLLIMPLALGIFTAVEIESINVLHQNTASEIRAGVESGYSMLLRLSSIGFGLLFGTSDQLVVTSGFMKLGMGLLLLSLGLVILQLLTRHLSVELNLSGDH